LHGQLAQQFVLRNPKAIHLIQGEYGEILGRLEVGVRKVACWSTKAALSLKRVKTEQKIYGGPIGTHQRSFDRYHPSPLWPPLFQDWGSQPPPKNPIAIISGSSEATDFKFGRHIHRVHPSKSPLKVFEKRQSGCIQGLSKFIGYSLFI